jgi:hypothetical protein
MKKIILSILTLVTITAFAGDNSKYVAAMEKNIKALYEAKNVDQYLNVANAFERIATAEKTEWLPSYYQAYANLMIGMQQKENNFKDEYFDKSLATLEKAEAVSKDNSEIYVLKSWATSMKIGIDPQARGMEMGMMASMYLEKAIGFNTENPRAYFMKAVGLMYTPEEYGGGKDKAIPVFETALEKFKSFKPENSIMPAWGKEATENKYAECKK